MIYTTHLGDELQKELAIAKEHKVPLLLDDAAGIPPADNAKLYAKWGSISTLFPAGKVCVVPSAAECFWAEKI